MSISAYRSPRRRKPAIWLVGTLQSPPLSTEARRRAGRLIDRVQWGEMLPMPFSRPMPSVGPHCHELRIRDGDHDWRVVYRIDADAVVVADVFQKTTRATPRHLIELCQWRLKRYDMKGKER
jgi:phage-related protein